MACLELTRNWIAARDLAAHPKSTCVRLRVERIARSALRSGSSRSLACSGPAAAGAGEPHYAIAMHGEPAMPEGFKAARYVNPDAPKGGRLVEGVLGSFDSLNPFIVKGLVAQGIRSPFVSGGNVISGYVVESLMARGYDEPFTLYGLIARTVETDDARSYVTFTLDPRGAIFRRQAGDAAGRPVLLAAPARPWPPQPPPLLRQGRAAPRSSANAPSASISPAATTASFPSSSA